MANVSRHTPFKGALTSMVATSFFYRLALSFCFLVTRCHYGRPVFSPRFIARSPPYVTVLTITMLWLLPRTARRRAHRAAPDQLNPTGPRHSEILRHSQVEGCQSDEADFQLRFDLVWLCLTCTFTLGRLHEQYWLVARFRMYLSTITKYILFDIIWCMSAPYTYIDTGILTDFLILKWDSLISQVPTNNLQADGVKVQWRSLSPTNFQQWSHVYPNSTSWPGLLTGTLIQTEAERQRREAEVQQSIENGLRSCMFYVPYVYM